jgi:RNA recognition motif-containing protein
MAKAGKELYVGSLSYDATEYDIQKMFSVSGTVTSIHLITDPVTGDFKGCGYVRMSTEAEAKDAIDSLDGAWLLDKSITVSYANPQKMKPGGGGAKALPKRWGKGTAEKSAAGKTAAPKAAAAKPAAAKPAAKPASSRPAGSRPATSKPASSRPSSAKPGSRSGKR